MSQKLIFKLHIQGPEGEKESILPVGVSQIGRQEGNQILLADSQVSRQHARLECTQEICQLIDLGSSNGTFLNSEKLQAHSPVSLKTGDQIKIGPFTLGFSQEAASVDEVRPRIGVEDFPSAPEESEKPKRKPGDKKTSDAGKLPPPPRGKAAIKPSLAADLFASSEYLHSRKLIEYLPGIYHSDFMSRFLGLFESILLPIEWTVDNFDLFLSPGTAPPGFLPWLENWFSLPPAVQWSQAQKRSFLAEAHQLYARRGTRWALSRLLEIHCGCQAQIIDTGDDLEPFTFIVKFPLPKEQVEQPTLSALIDASKPAYTTYRLEFI